MGENDDLTLVGTTDVDHGDGADRVRISTGEADYLKSIVRRLYPAYRGEPVASYSSLRPLIAQTGRSATSTSREHLIREKGRMLYISGGKYTTYRSMSEELVDLITPRIPSRTAEVPLSIPPVSADTAGRVRQAVEREFARHLTDLLQVSTYWGYERRASADWLAPLAREMGGLLGWDEARVKAETEAFLALAFVP